MSPAGLDGNPDPIRTPARAAVIATVADAIEALAPGRRLVAIAEEECRFLMRPLVSRGEWAGREPFGDPRPHRWDGPVAAAPGGGRTEH